MEHAVDFRPAQLSPDYTIGPVDFDRTLVPRRFSLHSAHDPFHESPLRHTETTGIIRGSHRAAIIPTGYIYPAQSLAIRLQEAASCAGQVF
jgi:hypothetical protein